MSENINEERLDLIMHAMPDQMNPHELSALICTFMEVYGMQHHWGDVAKEVSHMMEHFESIKRRAN